MRTVRHRYLDPLDHVWIACLEAVGLHLRRVPGAYATTDGKGELAIAPDDELDPDDSLAQMIFHELCHAAVAGPDHWETRDWGLDNETDRDVVLEHATLRAQAFYLRPFGLRTLLGPTTDFRAYYDALPEDPLAGDDPAIPLARIAIGRLRRAPFAPSLGEALMRTHEIVKASTLAVSVAAAHTTPRRRAEPPPSAALPPIFETFTGLSPFHRAGVPLPAPSARAAGESCGTCGWLEKGRCLSTESRRIPASDAACERWEPSPACETCGACCREAFHTLALSPREPFTKKHPALVVWRETMDGRKQPELPRPGGRCPPLRGDGVEPYRCSLYDDRPHTCRDFRRGGASCLEARRRVGLSV